MAVYLYYNYVQYKLRNRNYTMVFLTTFFLSEKWAGDSVGDQEMAREHHIVMSMHPKSRFAHYSHIIGTNSTYDHTDHSVTALPSSRCLIAHMPISCIIPYAATEHHAPPSSLFNTHTHQSNTHAPVTHQTMTPSHMHANHLCNTGTLTLKSSAHMLFHNCAGSSVQ